MPLGALLSVNLMATSENSSFSSTVSAPLALSSLTSLRHAAKASSARAAA
ncbi:MAG: hypothetical protein LBL94_04415 [Prevotellaceae bacterium]|nr:hypothetical protein [Prevotellaceae bacterium]